MKKILLIILVSLLCLTFFSCSDSGSSSSLSDQDRAVVLSSAFSAAGTGVASANASKKAAYVSLDGITVTGDFTTIDSGDYSMTITFTDYSDSNVTLNGSVTFACSSVTSFSMAGSFTTVYQGASYTFAMNINSDASGNMSGTLTVDGTVYNL